MVCMFMRGILHTIFMVQSKVEPPKLRYSPDCSILSQTPQGNLQSTPSCPPPWLLSLTTTTTTRAATNCVWSRRPLPPLPSCRRHAVHRRRAIHRHRHCLRCRRHRRRRCRRRRHPCCCRRRCVALVPSVTVASPSHCPSPLLPLAVVPSGRSGLARPAAALAPPLP